MSRCTYQIMDLYNIPFLYAKLRLPSSLVRLIQLVIICLTITITVSSRFSTFYLAYLILVTLIHDTILFFYTYLMVSGVITWFKILLSLQCITSLKASNSRHWTSNEWNCLVLSSILRPSQTADQPRKFLNSCRSYQTNETEEIEDVSHK